MKQVKVAPYQCHLCHKKYQQERAFIQHKCTQMKREEELRTPIGQAAWHYYQDWMRLQRKRVPDDRTFLKSYHYRSFNKFAEFVKKLKLPSPQLFIKLMIARTYMPSMWCSDEVYAIYMEHLDRNGSPKEHVDITIDTLCKIADDKNCEVNEVFEILTSGEIIQLIKQRKLSPWMLINSKQFWQFVLATQKKAPEHYIILGSIIRTDFWTKRFAEHPQAVESIKKIIAGLEL